jgi:hypothetical protein
MSLTMNHSFGEGSIFTVERLVIPAEDVRIGDYLPTATGFVEISRSDLVGVSGETDELAFYADDQTDPILTWPLGWEMEVCREVTR